MGLGTVTLLDINQVPSGKRIAYCLPTGEFIFVADTCAPEFEADQASDLYGGNLFQFLTINDTEKLKDFLRVQQHSNGNGNTSSLTFNPSMQMRMLVRLLGSPSTQLWIRLATIPLTLRMMRCIDTIRSFSNPLSQFADSSSFVLSEDEFSSMMRNPPMYPGSSSAADTPSPVEEGEDSTFQDFESSCLSPASFMSIVPLELKHRHPNFAISPTSLHLEDDDFEESGDDDDDPKASLANYAAAGVELPSNDIRFQMELEFIQCLASPAYLNFLAINRYFDNPTFMNYLQYLKYWKQPQYAKYIVYPHCLAFLDMLDDERFRQMIAREDFMTLVHGQQFYHWQTFLNNRSEGKPEEALPSAETPAAATPADTS
ncbi:hypothetical protein BBO99_00005129 [Phytophthora kernoviae]|uniref:Mediator of RNA polymerase II transcription subunit 31 n=2 Tax=Phytophthora kernoviae TaxID=325452 RepID=A0A3R7IL75_9STRA|nr:hypothetical protein G195_005699 [Phytophthora kernoviae 00238/432]KAG2524431.1 hypothetical protein JM16_004949 [Phytophthora kernoviae]KAG2526241.1 hypothetical protein JM18_004371 [Phytophthora kernoviae]RLN31723.1 hypothetical protein BBI17_005278 [Phytophthora kernoviae]RLN79617.1 hypothetical protein BBO99_00005129 [Phytophthora kernoviae]